VILCLFVRQIILKIFAVFYPSANGLLPNKSGFLLSLQQKSYFFSKSGAKDEHIDTETLKIFVI